MVDGVATRRLKAEEIAMFKFGAEKFVDEALLGARVLLMLLFLIFGWQKLTGFAGTVAYMQQVGAPAPQLSAAIAVIMELGVGALLLLGFYTRPLAILLLLYSLATALIGHRYWTLTGADRFEAMINFYKNISIMGGLMLLYIVGGGSYSIDGLRRRQ
jgi:putative oxidoreductase